MDRSDVRRVHDDYLCRSPRNKRDDDDKDMDGLAVV